MVTNVYLPQSTHSVKRLDCLPEPLSSTGLVVCFTERTTIILDVLQLNEKEKAQSFLSNGPDDPSYQDLRMAASTMTIVNDFAKRGHCFDAALQYASAKERRAKAVTSSDRESPQKDLSVLL